MIWYCNDWVVGLQDNKTGYHLLSWDLGFQRTQPTCKEIHNHFPFLSLTFCKFNPAQLYLQGYFSWKWKGKYFLLSISISSKHADFACTASIPSFSCSTAMNSRGHPCVSCSVAVTVFYSTGFEGSAEPQECSPALWKAVASRNPGEATMTTALTTWSKFLQSSESVTYTDKLLKFSEVDILWLKVSRPSNGITLRGNSWGK